MDQLLNIQGGGGEKIQDKEPFSQKVSLLLVKSTREKRFKMVSLILQ